MLYCVHYNNHTAPGFSPDESTPRRTSGYTTSCKDQEASGSSPQSPRKKEAGRRATLAQDYAGHQSGNSFYYRGFYHVRYPRMSNGRNSYQTGTLRFTVITMCSSPRTPGRLQTRLLKA
ncbi:hypothetical protein HBI53_082440 [Parastagonospora nodorum]|nr:hypothetical protein HBI69_019960 [Parastagonospora nodorum]KAH6219470.1 hypothetical protein HBI53_082440 [Parastagonospora nodorum]